MAKYKLIKNTTGVMREDGAQIPEYIGNCDWAEYLRWVADGGVVDPIDAYAPSLAEARTKKEVALKTEAMRILITSRDDLENSDDNISTLKANLKSDFQTAKTSLDGIHVMDDIENYTVIWSQIGAE
jgi:hypothetical protein